MKPTMWGFVFAYWLFLIKNWKAIIQSKFICVKYIVTFILSLISFCSFAQNQNSNYKTKKVAVKDTIRIDSVSINPNLFSIKRKDNSIIDSAYYTVDFAKALLTFQKTY